MLLVDAAADASADQAARRECLDIIRKWTPEYSPDLNAIREHGVKALDGDSGDESYEYSKVLRIEDTLTEFSSPVMYSSNQKAHASKVMDNKDVAVRLLIKRNSTPEDWTGEANARRAGILMDCKNVASVSGTVMYNMIVKECHKSVAANERHGGNLGQGRRAGRWPQEAFGV